MFTIPIKLCYDTENNVLDFLRKNRAEVIKVSIYEYDEELHFRTLYEEGVEDGMERGKKLGLAQAESFLARVNELNSILIELGRIDDLKRATQDKSYQKQLMVELLPNEMQNI